MTGDCAHPLAQLEADAGAGGRGAAAVLYVKCLACGERRAGPAGQRMLLDAVTADSAAFWSALARVGVRPMTPIVPREALEPGECAHFFSWLRLEGGETPRGATGVLSFRCVGCKTGWPFTVGLTVYIARLAQDHEALRTAIRKVGGVL